MVKKALPKKLKKEKITPKKNFFHLFLNRLKNYQKNTLQVISKILTNMRSFFIEIDDYTHIIDGFKNFIDLRRHVFER